MPTILKTFERAIQRCTRGVGYKSYSIRIWVVVVSKNRGCDKLVDWFFKGLLTNFLFYAFKSRKVLNRREVDDV